VEPDSIRSAVRELTGRKAVLDSLVTETMLQELDSLNPQQRERYLRILPWSRAGAGGRGPRGEKPNNNQEPLQGPSGE
jgi:hypothetical protein